MNSMARPIWFDMHTHIDGKHFQLPECVCSSFKNFPQPAQKSFDPSTDAIVAQSVFLAVRKKDVEAFRPGLEKFNSITGQSTHVTNWDSVSDEVRLAEVIRDWSGRSGVSPKAGQALSRSAQATYKSLFQNSLAQICAFQYE